MHSNFCFFGVFRRNFVCLLGYLLVIFQIGGVCMTQKDIKLKIIEQAEEIAVAQNINIGQVLINSGAITEEAIIKFLESKLHIPSVNLEDYTLDKNCLKYVNFSDARKYKIIPLFKIDAFLICFTYFYRLILSLLLN